MNKNKQTLVDKIVLWFLVAFCVMGGGLILLDNWAGRNDTPSYTGNLPPQKTADTIDPDKMQSGVRGMADFMVKDGNAIGLRMWARSLGVSSPEFSSVATLREEIRRASNDFAIYRDKKEFMGLVSLLADSDALFIETLNESMR